MRKIFIEGFVIVVLFFATWFILNEIDWMSLFKVEQVSKKTEKKLGELFWEFFNKQGEEIKSDDILQPVDTLLTRICESNGFDKSEFSLHILPNTEINAFALPDNQLIIYTSLLSACKNESELCGVICHEIAHMKMNHVMKKLIKEAGLSVIISVSTGNNSGEVAREVAKLLSSTAYDRKLEKEADLKAVEYLVKSDISPVPFADFLSRLGDKESSVESNLIWISTHPDSRERAEYIKVESEKETINIHSVLTDGSWEKFQSSLKNI